MSNPLSKPAYVVMVRQLSAGLREHYAGLPLLVNDREMSVEDVIAKLESLQAARAGADALEVEYRRQLAACRASWPEVHAMITALFELLRGRHGRYNPMLADFGIQPRRRVVLTSAQKALAAAKRKATRALNAARAAQPRTRASMPPTPPTASAPVARRPARRELPATLHPRLRTLWPHLIRPTGRTPFS
jgi:hypothetical protein